MIAELPRERLFLIAAATIDVLIIGGSILFTMLVLVIGFLLSLASGVSSGGIGWVLVRLGLSALIWLSPAAIAGVAFFAQRSRRASRWAWQAAAVVAPLSAFGMFLFTAPYIADLGRP